MNFSQIGLSAELLRALKEQGYQEATPIQQKAIPAILDGKDILAAAQTGTGKTAGFTLPILRRLQDTTPEQRHRRIRALILTPTRELAAQVAESVRTYGRHLPFRTAVVYGGVSINPQIAKFRKGVDIVVATPGRLLDHMRQGTVCLDHVDTLVLDEADRMLDMGFIKDIRWILKSLPAERQNLLFSATFSDDIRNLAARLLSNPTEIQVARKNSAVERVSQVVHPVDRTRKPALLSYLIGAGNWRQVLVFTRTKHGADRLTKQLIRDGLSATAIHGRKSQGARTRALADFKKGDVRVLVATDIAARGLDIDRLPHVVNFELPNVPEDYVHRIGRTARAGQDGHAVSLVCVDEKKLLADIERLLKKPIERVVIEGFEPDPNAKPAPVKGRNGQRPPRGGRPSGGPGAGRRGPPRSRGNKGRGRSSRQSGNR